MNINKIRVKNIKYSKKGYTVICIIHWYNPITNTYQKSKGVAKCNPDDTFDLVKGQRIAESRAKLLCGINIFLLCIKKDLRLLLNTII